MTLALSPGESTLVTMHAVWVLFVGRFASKQPVAIGRYWPRAACDGRPLQTPLLPFAWVNWPSHSLLHE